MSLQFGCNETLPHYWCQSRIGRAIAMKLAAPDVMLLLHGRDTVALAETCRALEKAERKRRNDHDLANFRGIDDLVAESDTSRLICWSTTPAFAVVKHCRKSRVRNGSKPSA